MPSIVSITNKSVQEVQNYFSMFGYGGQAQEVESTSVGSGIIIGKNDTEPCENSIYRLALQNKKV